MKFRKGFVSNSSSTSFALAVAEGQQEKSLTMMLLFGDRPRLTTVQELNDWFLEEWGYDEAGDALEKMLADARDNERYQVLKSAIEDGRHIVFGQASLSGDDPITALLDGRGFPAELDAKVLYNEM